MRTKGLGNKVRSHPKYKELLQYYAEHKGRLSTGAMWLKWQGELSGINRATFYRWVSSMKDKVKTQVAMEEVGAVGDLTALDLETSVFKSRLKKAAIKLGLQVLLDPKRVAELPDTKKLDIAFRAAALHQAEQELMVTAAQQADVVSRLERAMYTPEVKEVIEIRPYGKNREGEDLSPEEDTKPR